MKAAAQGHLAVATLLCDIGADVNYAAVYVSANTHRIIVFLH
jgi:hypothetical protein